MEEDYLNNFFCNWKMHYFWGANLCKAQFILQLEVDLNYSVNGRCPRTLMQERLDDPSLRVILPLPFPEVHSHLTFAFHCEICANNYDLMTTLTVKFVQTSLILKTASEHIA